jgi:hypothetical protein
MVSCARVAMGSRCSTKADGSHHEAARIPADLLEVLGEEALALYAPETPQEIAAPLDRVVEAI